MSTINRSTYLNECQSFNNAQFTRVTEQSDLLRDAISEEEKCLSMLKHAKWPKETGTARNNITFITLHYTDILQNGRNDSDVVLS